MTSEGRILVVDDDTSFLDMYTEILREEGYIAETARDHASALAKLDAGGWSTVLLDQKLQGPGGPDGGLDLIEEALQRCPGAQVIVITGYATSESVTRAFTAGAYDLIEKTEVLAALLRLKLRGAQSLHRAQQRPLRRPELEELWQAAQTATDPQRKGKLLEDLVASIFRGIPELGPVVSVNRRNDIEEIDIIVRNECAAAPWNRESTYFLVECKNWSRPTDRAEYDIFVRKLQRRRGRCGVGFLVAPGGFTQALKDLARRDAHQEPYVILLARAELEQLIAAPDRMAVLARLHVAATMGDASK